MQTGLTFLAKAVDPAVRALSRHALSFRGMGDCPALLADALEVRLGDLHRREAERSADTLDAVSARAPRPT